MHSRVGQSQCLPGQRRPTDAHPSFSLAVVGRLLVASENLLAIQSQYEEAEGQRFVSFVKALAASYWSSTLSRG